MTIPTTAYAVAIFLVLVLPGIVHGVVRASVSGTRPHDRDWTPRILQAILVSVILDAVYLLAFVQTAVSWMTGSTHTLRAQPRLAALAVLCLGVLIPALLAYLRHAELRWREVTVRGHYRARNFWAPRVTRGRGRPGSGPRRPPRWTGTRSRLRRRGSPPAGGR